ncbi:MAG: hypothetical protein KDB22_23110 [Planctomycetales bacterium]|nr:hypothetical protein [Planctomycetales bacterium]
MLLAAAAFEVAVPNQSRALGQESEQHSAASDTAAISAESVRVLLRQLDADELAQRDAAEQQLIQLGAGVLPLLPAVTPRTSGEMKVRLERIRQSLQQESVEVFFEASKVSISGTMTLGEAIAEIQDQTGNEIQLRGEGEGTEVQLNCQDEEFWTVVGQLVDQANLRIASFATTDNALVLTQLDGASPSPVSAYSVGPFRVDAVSVRTSLPIAYALRGTMELSYNVSWEPRLKPIFMQIPMSTVTAAINDQSINVANAAATPEIALNVGGCTAQVDLQFERPPRSAESLTSVAGTFVMAVPSEEHKYVFTKFGERQTQTFGDVSVTLERARRNGPVYEMPLYVEFGDAQGALDSFRGWIRSNEAYLLDPKGVRIDDVGYNTYAASGNAVGIAYRFQLNGDPEGYQLVYRSPAKISKQSVSFELKDVPLP